MNMAQSKLVMISLVLMAVVAVVGVPANAQNEKQGKESYKFANKEKVAYEVELQCSDYDYGSGPNCQRYTPDPRCCKHFHNSINSDWKLGHNLTGSDDNSNNTVFIRCNGNVIMSWVFVFTFALIVVDFVLA